MKESFWEMRYFKHLLVLSKSLTLRTVFGNLFIELALGDKEC